MRLLRPFLRGMPIILATMGIMLLTVNVYLRYATPVFESTAKIKLAETKYGVSNSNLYKDFDVFASESKIEAEVELLKSHSLVEKALQNLDIGTSIYRVGKIHKKELYDESPVKIVATVTNPKWEDELFKLTISGATHKVKITTPDGAKLNGLPGDTLYTQGIAIIIIANNELLRHKPFIQLNDRYEFVVHNHDALVNNIAEELDVMSVDKEVPVLRISYKCPVPKKCADIVNSVANAYIVDYIQEKSKAADTTASFLEGQLSRYGAQLKSSEQSIESYRNLHGIVNIPQETETDLRKIADLKKQLANVHMSLNAARSLNQYMDGGSSHAEDLAPAFEEFSDLLSTELIKKLKLLQADRRDLLTRLTPENEKVQTIDNNIRDITTYMQESVRNTERDLSVKEKELSRSIDEAESAFSGLPEKERNLTILERDFGQNEQIFRFLHEKETEAEIAKAATISFHRIISKGEVPLKPVSPNAKLLLVLGGFLGLLLGALVVYIRNGIKGQVADATTIYRASDTPIAACIPRLKDDAAAKRFFRKWILEMELKEALPQGAQLVVSSLNAGEGKSFIAGHLAAAAAGIGKNVLLISLDNRQSQIKSKHLECACAKDLQKSWGLPAQWKALSAMWREAYDLIVIQNAAIREEPASMTAMSEAAVNLMVLDSNRTKQRSITEADALKTTLNIPAMHFVLNHDGYAPGIITQVKRRFRTHSHA